MIWLRMSIYTDAGATVSGHWGVFHEATIRFIHSHWKGVEQIVAQCGFVLSYGDGVSEMYMCVCYWYRVYILYYALEY